MAERSTNHYLHQSAKSSAVILLLGCLLAACSSSATLYHLTAHEWHNRAITMQVKPVQAQSTPPITSATIVCTSCNLPTDAQTIQFDSTGRASVTVSNAIFTLEPRLHITGHGIDTTFIQHARPPVADAQFFQLRAPLIGRVLVLSTSPLYLDSTQEHIAATTQRGDELNIFGETKYFYEVHHPQYSAPLYLLKTNATRITAAER